MFNLTGEQIKFIKDLNSSLWDILSNEYFAGTEVYAYVENLAYDFEAAETEDDYLVTLDIKFGTINREDESKNRAYHKQIYYEEWMDISFICGMIYNYLIEVEG